MRLKEVSAAEYIDLKLQELEDLKCAISEFEKRLDLRDNATTVRIVKELLKETLGDNYERNTKR